MDASAPIILAIVALAVVALVAMARRRSWNSDGSDDDRRRDLDAPDVQDAD